MDKKKLTGGLAGLLAVVLFGGSQVLDLGARLSALEDLHPELVTEIPDNPHEVPAEPPVEPESTGPAPGEEALELDENDEWVPTELDEALEAAEEE